MKKLVFLLLLSMGAFAQDTEFKLSKEGFTDFIVTPIEGKTAADLYKKTLEWINVTYKNPKEVIKAQIENDYIRFMGSSYGIFSIGVLGSKTGYDTRYTTEVSFKDGKYKFDIINIEYYITPNQYGTGGWYDLTFDKMDEYYNKKGELKGRYKYLPETLAPYFNNLNAELLQYIQTNQTVTKKSDW